MRVCVSGSSGSGKTTLARRVAREMGIPYHDASFGRIASGLGYDAVRDQTVSERMTMQEDVLSAYAAEIAGQPSDFITDRCPLDMIGYALGEVTMHAKLGDLDARVHHYVERCLAATDDLFDVVFVVRPLDRYEMIPGRPPPSVSYRWAVHYLIEGSGGRLARTKVFVLADADLEVRVEESIRTLQLQEYRRRMAVAG